MVRRYSGSGRISRIFRSWSVVSGQWLDRRLLRAFAADYGLRTTDKNLSVAHRPWLIEVQPRGYALEQIAFDRAGRSGKHSGCAARSVAENITQPSGHLSGKS